MVELLKPTGRIRLVVSEPIAGIGNLEKTTVGFLDNSKPNFAMFLDRLELLLLRDYNVAKIIRGRKHQPSFLAVDIIDQLAQQCVLVIAGSCD